MNKINTAATANDLDAVKTAILAGEDVNSVDAEGNTALSWALFHGNEAMFALLLRAGASAYQDVSPVLFTGEPKEDEETGNDWPSQTSWPVIIAAAYAKQWGMVRQLIAAGADYHVKCYDTDDVAGHAIHQNQLAELKFLLDKQLKINMRRRGGDTLLMSAVWANSLDAVTMLLQHGANPFIDDREKRTPALVALQYKDFSLCQAIMDYKWGERKLHWYLLLPDLLSNLLQQVEWKKAGTEEVRYIITKMMEFKGDTAMRDALENGLRRVASGSDRRREEPNLPILQLMVEMGVSLNLNNPRMRSAYSIAETMEANGEAARLLRQAMLND